MKISPKLQQICQSRLNILPNKKYTVKNLPKTSKLLPKWQNFATSGHTVCSSCFGGVRWMFSEIILIQFASTNFFSIFSLSLSLSLSLSDTQHSRLVRRSTSHSLQSMSWCTNLLPLHEGIFSRKHLDITRCEREICWMYKSWEEIQENKFTTDFKIDYHVNENLFCLITTQHVPF